MGSARRVIAILGAGGTLGTALSRQLAAEPDTDLVLSDLSDDALAQAADDLAASAGAVATVPADSGVPNSSARAWAVRCLDRNCPT